MPSAAANSRAIWPWCRCRACCRRLVRLPRDGRAAAIIFSWASSSGHYLADFFPGTKILGYWHFRVTRNSELYIDEEDAGNLLKAVENELHNRRKGDAVRLEVEHDCPRKIRHALLGTFDLTEDDLYLIDGPLNPTRLMAIYEGDHSPELARPAVRRARRRAPCADETDIFAAIRERDVLLHHPYESFDSVVEFLEQAGAATRRCWPSSKRSIAPAATRASSAR